MLLSNSVHVCTQNSCTFYINISLNRILRILSGEIWFILCSETCLKHCKKKPCMYWRYLSTNDLLSQLINDLNTLEISSH